MPRPMKWVPQSQLDRMQTDLMQYEGITKAQLAERLLEEAAPIATYSIVDTAANSEDEGLRLRAAQYILDRVNGKARTSIHLDTTPQNPVIQLLDGVVLSRPDDDDEDVTDPVGVAVPRRPVNRYNEGVPPVIIDQDPAEQEDPA